MDAPPQLLGARIIQIEEPQMDEFARGPSSPYKDDPLQNLMPAETVHRIKI